MGEAMEDEDRNMLYKLEIIFPELPNSRMIKFALEEDGRLVARLSEMPSEKIAEVFLKEMNGTNPKLTLYMNLIERRLGKNAAGKRITEAFAPTLIGARIGSPEYSAVMDSERERAHLQDRTSRWIDSLVNKLLHEDEDDSERGFIGDIVDKIKQKRFKKQNPTEGKNASLEDTEQDLNT